MRNTASRLSRCLRNGPPEVCDELVFRRMLVLLSRPAFSSAYQRSAFGDCAEVELISRAGWASEQDPEPQSSKHKRVLRSGQFDKRLKLKAFRTWVLGV